MWPDRRQPGTEVQELSVEEKIAVLFVEYVSRPGKYGLWRWLGSAVLQVDGQEPEQ